MLRHADCKEDIFIESCRGLCRDKTDAVWLNSRTQSLGGGKVAPRMHWDENLGADGGAKLNCAIGDMFAEMRVGGEKRGIGIADKWRHLGQLGLEIVVHPQIVLGRGRIAYPIVEIARMEEASPVGRDEPRHADIGSAEGIDTERIVGERLAAVEPRDAGVGAQRLIASADVGREDVSDWET